MDPILKVRSGSAAPVPVHEMDLCTVIKLIVAASCEAASPEERERYFHQMVDMLLTKREEEQQQEIVCSTDVIAFVSAIQVSGCS